MVKQLSNKEIYSNQEFKGWAEKGNGELIPAEKYLISKYLKNPGGRVIEAGTGGGRIAFNIERMGFLEITAFDYVPAMIEMAELNKQRRKSNVKLLVLDAANLNSIDSNSFDYLIYLQQVVCFIPGENREQSIKESYRIAKDGAISIFSFLLWEGRILNIAISYFLNTLRFFRGEPISIQTLPWLKFNNKFNRSFLNKGQATNYWFRRDEIISILKRTGYTILENKTAAEILNSGHRNSKMLYVVCRK